MSVRDNIAILKGLVEDLEWLDMEIQSDTLFGFNLRVFLRGVEGGPPAFMGIDGDTVGVSFGATRVDSRLIKDRQRKFQLADPDLAKKVQECLSDFYDR